MNTATVVTESRPAFTSCALVQTYTDKVRHHGLNDAGECVFLREETRTREVHRMEFIAMGEWVLIRTISTWSYRTGAWEPYTRDEARDIYKAHLAGKGWNKGEWSAAPAHTVIIGTRDLPAVRDYYSYGETAYMYTMVDFPEMTCPVIADERGKKFALRPFNYTTPPTPGDRYSHNRKAIQWNEIRD